MTPCNIEHSQHFYGGGTQRVMSDLFQQPLLIKKLSYMLSETIRTAQPVLIKWVSSLLGETIPTACAHKNGCLVCSLILSQQSVLIRSRINSIL